MISAGINWMGILAGTALLARICSSLCISKAMPLCSSTRMTSFIPVTTLALMGSLGTLARTRAALRERPEFSEVTTLASPGWPAAMLFMTERTVASTSTKLSRASRFIDSVREYSLISNSWVCSLMRSAKSLTKSWITSSFVVIVSGSVVGAKKWRAYQVIFWKVEAERPIAWAAWAVASKFISTSNIPRGSSCVIPLLSRWISIPRG